MLDIFIIHISFLSWQICTPDLVMFLACTNHRLKERLHKRAEQQGRPDDNPKAIDRRLTNFKQNTIPLLKYFQERELIVTVRGGGWCVICLQCISQTFNELKPLQMLPALVKTAQLANSVMIKLFHYLKKYKPFKILMGQFPVFLIVLFELSTFYAFTYCIFTYSG